MENNFGSEWQTKEWKEARAECQNDFERNACDVLFKNEEEFTRGLLAILNSESSSDDQNPSADI